MEGLDALKISEDKKKYIMELLNPVLEEMVAECIHRMPSDPVPFMLEWLEQKKVIEEDKLLSPQEKERLAQENSELSDNVVKVKSQMQEAAKLAVDDKRDEAEASDEEEDDEDDEPPPDFYKREDQPPKARQSVSAEAYGDWNTKKVFVPPVIPKTDEQKDRLKNCLCKSFLFSGLEVQDMTIVIGAMKEVQCAIKHRVINQGDNGDFLFVIESGRLDCIIKLPDGSEKVVKSCAASVECTEKAVLWQLDRDTFNAIVKDAAQKKRERYDHFLSKVPLLASMDAYERSQLADAIKCEKFGDNMTIVTQGEVGNKFYILEDGEAVALKNGVQVMSYAAGDYFGELALIRNQPRAATVKAKGQTTNLLSIDSRSFKRLLNVNDLLERSAQYS